MSTETDKELLEMAAKAADIDAEFHPELGPNLAAANEGMWLKGERTPDNSKYWNPLTCDGDALRLAVKLGISVSFSHSTGLDVPYPTIAEVGAFAGWCPTFTESYADDWVAATRCAIVRAAAEIGRALP